MSQGGKTGLAGLLYKYMVLKNISNIPIKNYLLFDWMSALLVELAVTGYT